MKVNNLDRYFASLATLGSTSRVASTTDEPVGSSARTGSTLRPASSTTVTFSDAARLKSALSGLRESSRRLSQGDLAVGFTIASSNPDFSASLDDPIRRATDSTLAVSQKALSQKLQSPVFSENAIVGTGTLAFEFGRFNTTTNSFSPDGTGSRQVAVGVLESTVGGVVNAVNGTGVGITARTLEETTGYRIEFEGAGVGREQAFRVSVSSDADQNNTDNAAGLSRLAFDPSATSGEGRNLTQTQTAQDAAGTVNGAPFTSPDNRLDGVVPGATVDVAATGSSRISATRNYEQTVTAARNLVEAVNLFRSQTAGVGGTVGQRINGEISTALDGAVSSESDKRTLASVGVTRGSDGRLRLDEDKLKLAFAGADESVVSVLGKAASQVEGAAEAGFNSSSLRVSGAVAAAPSLRNTSRAEADNPYLAQARLRQFQTLQTATPSVLSYLPTTRNLYGLSQYLNVSRL